MNAYLFIRITELLRLCNLTMSQSLHILMLNYIMFVEDDMIKV